MPTYYAIIDAPGHYGDHAHVWSCHRAITAARRRHTKYTNIIASESPIPAGRDIPQGVLADMINTGLWRLLND